MNYTLTIHCTKEHLEKAKWCNLVRSKNFHANDSILGGYQTGNCWIAVAVQSVFPLCGVDFNEIDNSHRRRAGVDKEFWNIPLPEFVTKKIFEFDGCGSVEQREQLKPFSFDVTFSQETFETILRCNGFACQQDFKTVCQKAGNLELVSH